jgi:hypothetical protein
LAEYSSEGEPVGGDRRELAPVEYDDLGSLGSILAMETDPS